MRKPSCILKQQRNGRLRESAGGTDKLEPSQRSSALPDGHILVDVVDISEHDLPRQHREGEGACKTIRHAISSDVSIKNRGIHLIIEMFQEANCKNMLLVSEQ